MPSDIDCYTEFSIKYLNIDYYSEAERASNLMNEARLRRKGENKCFK